jgi:photosystem II stability/assembly factor-like uncharacterized protein
MRSVHLVPILFITFTGHWIQSDEIVTFKKPVLRSVRFVDHLHGWMAGYRGVFHTSDGGATWRRQPVTVGSTAVQTAGGVVEGHGIIAWADQSRAIVRSDNGLVDGSVNSEGWKNLTLLPPVKDHMRLVSFSDAQTGFGLSSVGTFYQTTDGGTTWDSNYGRISGLPKGLFVSSPTEIWVAEGKATILHTTDAGRSWTRSEFGVLADFHCILFVDQDEAWITGSDGIVYHTADGGKQWTRQKTPFSRYTSLFAASFVDRNEGWVVGSRYIKELPGPDANRFEAVILHTEDGGETWVAQASNSKDLLLSVQALPNGHAWAVGQNGAVLRTTDHGLHWNPMKIE